ncbi:MAG: hypothetical protein JRJ86_22875 [Deltaproteobacteria bacterium]|nr:hypothetical protein [Deltaproteobacteria bacterium]MBW2116638.1 hypothetical protein [Deltaproteobacteria bacterium]
MTTFCEAIKLDKELLRVNFDELVKSQKISFFVIPSRIGDRDDGQAGIQCFQKLIADLDPGFRLSACVRAQAGLGDDFL